MRGSGPHPLLVGEVRHAGRFAKDLSAPETPRTRPTPSVLARRSERAVALLSHLFLHSRRGGEGRNRLADDLVIRRPLQRLGRHLLIPDLADAGVIPADHIVAGLRGACEGKARDSDAGGGTESGSATHGEPPVGNYCHSPAAYCVPRRWRSL